MNTEICQENRKNFKICSVDVRYVAPFITELERFHSLTHARGEMLRGVLGPMFEDADLDLEGMYESGVLSMISDLFELIDHTQGAAVFCALDLKVPTPLLLERWQACSRNARALAHDALILQNLRSQGSKCFDPARFQPHASLLKSREL